MKTVTLYRPMSIEGAMKDFDRYMESFFGDNLLAPASKAIAGSQLRLPAMDVQETKDAYTVEIEVPGFDEKNIEVHVDAKEITVASKTESKQEESIAEKSPENYTEENSAEQKARFLLKERKQSHFRRTFSLPENADYESISAKFKNGILSLEVKKLPEAKKRTIRIETI
jgi:HSP20 family protein